jgi:hypothetical protein
MECAADIPRAGILKFLSAAGLVCRFFASCNAGRPLALIELEGFLPIDHDRLHSFRTALGSSCRLSPMGGYAVPLAPAQLVPKV